MISKQVIYCDELDNTEDIILNKVLTLCMFNFYFLSITSSMELLFLLKKSPVYIEKMSNSQNFPFLLDENQSPFKCFLKIFILLLYILLSQFVFVLKLRIKIFLIKKE